MKQTKFIAKGGIYLALCVMILFLRRVFPFLDISVFVLSSIVITVSVLELKIKGGVLVYLGSAIMSFFLLPTPETVFLFVLLFGPFPIMKSLIERRFRGPLEYIIKFLYANATLALGYALFSAIILAEFSSLPMLVFAYAVYNVSFFAYDFVLSWLIPSIEAFLRRKNR